MTTNKQRTANRENAKHSTGPTTEAGKQTCSQNGLKHGLASGQLLIPGECEDEFNDLLARLLSHHKPENITETLLVQDMAKYHWLADRALRLQANSIGCTFATLSQTSPLLSVLMRYHAANLRAFQKSLAMLNDLRKRRLAENGSASKDAAEEDSSQPRDFVLTYFDPDNPHVETLPRVTNINESRQIPLWPEQGEHLT